MGTIKKKRATDFSAQFLAPGEANTVIDSLVKVCITVTAAGVIALVSSSNQTRTDVAVMKEQIGKLEQRQTLTPADLTNSLQPLQTTVTQHLADLSDTKRKTEDLDKRVSAVETDIGYIRRDIGTITDVLKTGADDGGRSQRR